MAASPIGIAKIKTAKKSSGAQTADEARRFLSKGTASEVTAKSVLLKGTASAVPQVPGLACGFSR
jgi:hypothetical protein